VLRSGTPAPGVDSVALNYLPKNAAPEIDDLTVQVGVKFQPLPKTSGLSLGSDSTRIFRHTFRAFYPEFS